MEDLSTKGLVGFHDFGLPLSPSGVYTLVLRGVVVYVGKSLNVYARVGQHIWAMKRNKAGKRPYKNKAEYPPIDFDEVKVKWVPVHFLDREELALIQRYRPEFNTLENRPNIDVSHVPGVAKLIASGPKVTMPSRFGRTGSVKRRAA